MVRKWYFASDHTFAEFLIGKGTTVTATMKTKPALHATLRKSRGQPFSVTCSTAIAIWITCSRCASNTNFTLLLRRKWKKCSSTTCPGSRYVHLYSNTVSYFIFQFYLTSRPCAQVQFLKKAVDILCQCRQTLMYTYVFAYYLKKNNQSVIFEVSFLKKSVH